jgi:signal transduction histidine kinase/ligand-binding sensor domain-containing protein
MRGLSITVACLFVQLCVGQELRFQRLSTENGLSDNAINCLFQDREGHLWLGTERGLDRFDGQRVDPIAGSEFAISGITEDAQGRIWVATKGDGLLLVDHTRRNVERIYRNTADPKSIASDQLTAVFDLNDTTLLLGSREQTLIFMDKRTRMFSYWADSTSLDPKKASALPVGRSGWCHAITPLNDDLLWIGLLNNHMSLLVDRTSSRITKQLTIKRAGSETESCALLQGDVLYLGGWQNGIDVLPIERALELEESRRLVPQVIETPDEILSLAPWTDGSVLAGTRSMGLLRYHLRTGDIRLSKHLRSDPSSLPSDRIRCQLVDRAGTLWVGTANGLAYHAPSVWSMTVDPIFSVDDDTQPELFFHRLEAEEESGIRAFTSNGFHTRLSPDLPFAHKPLLRNGMELQPTTHVVDHLERDLLGTEYGIVEWHQAEGRFTDVVLRDEGQFRHTPGEMYQVRAVFVDTIGTTPVFVIGILGFGVQVVEARTRVILGNAMPAAAYSGNARALVNDMVRDSRGTYWIASGDGIYTWDRNKPLTKFEGTPRTRSTSEGIRGPGLDIVQLEILDDTVWAVSREGRLLRVLGDQAKVYEPTWTVGSMHGLEADANGKLWITTDDGLLRFDQRTSSFIRVPVNDGRTFRKLTRAITRLPNGLLAFAANNSVITFDPRVYDVLPAIPSAYLNSISAAGAPVEVTNGGARVNYRSGAIDIVISALAFGLPAPLMVNYRLEGVEDGWRTTTASELIRYAGIPVGEHRLLVRVLDPYGRLGPEQTLLTIQVAGPFWQQWWFYALAAVFVSLGAYAWSRYRLAQALELQTVRNRIASDLHDEVGSSLSSITIGSKLAAQLSTSESAQVKEILARIGETSSESLRSISDIVWAIDPKNDQGEALVKRMRRIANELLDSKGIDVRFDVRGGVEDLKLPMNARKEIVLIFKEAVHNASKYSGAQQVRIVLERRSHTLNLSIEDDGCGFDPRLHPDGHGLGSMNRRAAALRSPLKLDSAPGAGTRIGINVDITGIRD